MGKGLTRRSYESYMQGRASGIQETTVKVNNMKSELYKVQDALHGFVLKYGLNQEQREDISKIVNDINTALAIDEMTEEMNSDITSQDFYDPQDYIETVFGNPDPTVGTSAADAWGAIVKDSQKNNQPTHREDVSIYLDEDNQIVVNNNENDSYMQALKAAKQVFRAQ